MHPSTPLIGVASSSLVDPSLINDASITTVSQSAPPISVAPLSLVDPSSVNNASITTVSSATDPAPLTGVAPLSLVDPSAIPSFVSEVNNVMDHSTTLLNNVTHINSDPNAQLHMMLMMVTHSTVMGNMNGKEPIPVCNTSMVSHASLEPLLGPLIVGLGNPEALATEMLIDATATALSNTPSNLPTNIPTHTSEKGPTGLAKKARVMQPNPQSKMAR